MGQALLPGECGQNAVVLLLPWLDDMLPRLRNDLKRGSVADHGKVVTDTSWRVCRITSSNRGLALDLSMGQLTFDYMEGGTPRRITLDLMPDQLHAVRDAIGAMLA